MNTPAWTPDDPDGNGAELQTLVDNESVVVLPSSYTGGTAATWPCAPITLPDDHAVRLIGGGCTVRPAGLAGIEAWCAGSDRAVAHIVGGINLEGKGGVGVGFRPGSGWSLYGFSVTGLRAGVQIVQDKSYFGHFSINKCGAGFLVGPTWAHGGGQQLSDGGAESCDTFVEVATQSQAGAKDGGRIEAWLLEAVHLGNVGVAFGRSGGASQAGDPPLLIDCVFERLGAERLGARYVDSGPAGIVGGNVWVGGNASFDGESADNLSGWRDDNVFVGTEAASGRPMTWDDVTHASAFVVGIIVGVLLTIRVVRAVALVLSRQLKDRSQDDDDRT